MAVLLITHVVDVIVVTLNQYIVIVTHVRVVRLLQAHLVVTDIRVL